MDKPAVGLSKFLSFVLRHQPEAIGIALDREGWVDINALIVAAQQFGRHIDRAELDVVVRENDKRRFALSDDGLRIRAVQGHSTTSVARDLAPQFPPELLYHGTATRFLAAILVQGLRSGSRHHVHLSVEVDTAMQVGQRHGKAVVLTVAAAQMQSAGFTFYRAENGVWLTAQVPPTYLRVTDVPGQDPHRVV